MGGDRFTRSGMPYGTDSDYGQGYDDGGMPQGGYMGYGDGQPAGFNRHQSSNARRVAAQNPIKDGVSRLGSAFSGLRQAAVSRVPKPAARSPRAEVTRDDGDYLGVGNPCRVCGNPVDPTQIRCPHCGAFVRPLYQHIGFIVAIVVAIVAIVLLSLAISSCKGTAPAEPGPTNPGTDPAATVAPTGDKSALTAATASAQAVLDANPSTHTYTAYSIANLQAAVNNANAVINNPDATDEEVAQAAQSVSDAMGALVNPLADYPWPMYADLVADIPGFIGHQIAINGTTQTIETDANGLNTATMAVSGDSTCIVYIQYYGDALNGELYPGSDFTALGTVTGDLNGLPVILADQVDVL